MDATPSDQRETAQYGGLLNDLGVLSQKSNYDEAYACYVSSQAIWEKALGSGHPLVGQSLFNRAALYRRTRNFPEAELLFKEAELILGSSMAGGEYLWADRYDARGILEEFGADVRDLRARADSGTPEGQADLAMTLERLGPWYHNLNYSGIQTNPATPDYPASRWRTLSSLIPMDLRGKTVLDIGTNSGFFALEMKRRGADRVVGIDIMPHVLAQARFASHWFGLPLEIHQHSAYDVESLGMQFDIVVFIGVLYHLKHPLYALEKIASVCRESMYLYSMVRGSTGDFVPKDDYPANEVGIFEHPDFPRMYFIEKSVNGDDSNWWFATRSCLKAMARVSGFKDVQETADPELLVCRK